MNLYGRNQALRIFLWVVALLVKNGNLKNYMNLAAELNRINLQTAETMETKSVRLLIVFVLEDPPENTTK